MPGVTVVVEDKGNETIAKQVIESSRRLYAKEVMKESEAGNVKAPGKPKATRSSPAKQSSRKQSNGLKDETSLK